MLIESTQFFVRFLFQCSCSDASTGLWLYGCCATNETMSIVNGFAWQNATKPMTLSPYGMCSIGRRCLQVELPIFHMLITVCAHEWMNIHHSEKGKRTEFPIQWKATNYHLSLLTWITPSARSFFATHPYANRSAVRNELTPIYTQI